MTWSEKGVPVVPGRPGSDLWLSRRLAVWNALKGLLKGSR